MSVLSLPSITISVFFDIGFPSHSVAKIAVEMKIKNNKLLITASLN